MWADIDDSDDDGIELLPDDEELIDTRVHIYSTPIVVGDLTMHSTDDVREHRDFAYEALARGLGEEVADMLWPDTINDLLNFSDPEEMDAAARDLALYYQSFSIEVTEESMQEGIAAIHEPENVVSDEIFDASAYLDDAMDQLPLDDPAMLGSNTYFMKPDRTPPTQYRVLNQRNSVKPPLAPDVPVGMPSHILFCGPLRDTEEPIFINQGRLTWTQVFSQNEHSLVPEGCMDDLNSVADTTCRSGTRPGIYRSVFMVWADGSRVNIGSHAYQIREDHSISLDFSTSSVALAELFSAPGGEGLTCATPSHTLHQMVSAVLSEALQCDDHKSVESDSIDIVCDDFAIDITTSAGIWQKVLVPPDDRPHHRYQSAISKYDIAAVMLHHTDVNVAKAFLRATANCLATEYPGYFRLQHADVPQDLILQNSIYEAVTKTPNAVLDQLKEMCYEASIQESLEELNGFQLHDHGEEYKHKAQRIIRAIDKLRPRNQVAIPPIPITEITGLPAGDFKIKILGHDFEAGPVPIQGRTQGPRHKMDSCEQFLERFPASGRVPHEDAKVIAEEFDDTFLTVGGLTHKGPSRESVTGDTNIIEYINDVYSKSPVSQLVEIRADLARAIDALPFPSVNVWQQVHLYAGKVCVWYRSRDPTSSPEGYRIDWFAVSSFSVLGARPISTTINETLYLWPRQRIRSQELDMIRCGPRRLKLVLYSMVEKAKVAGATLQEVLLAWQRLAFTLVSSKWGSGKNFITCRYLSAALTSPSSPFGEMEKKFSRPTTFADVLYFGRLKQIMANWTVRNQYHKSAAILGLPRAYAQLESYWMLWVPDEYADTEKHLAECIIALKEEHDLLVSTQRERLVDLRAQLILINNNEITLRELRASLRASCSLDTGGKLGWTWVGSLAAAYALELHASPAAFDRSFAKGTTSRTLVDHLTVRHSAKLDINNVLRKGTVAQMMLSSDPDIYLSTINQTHKFLFTQKPFFFNHPKNGEHKDREISITDPDSRICLSDAEYICGNYGRRTNVDFLKVSAKDTIFYKRTAVLMERGSCIQSSDASRYGPMMSNIAIAIMLYGLSTKSMHLRWASVVYARLSYRVMLLSRSCYPYLNRQAQFKDTRAKMKETLSWMNKMRVYGTHDSQPLVGYTTSTHMGQGMSHHSSSLLHAGGLIISQDAVCRCKIVVNGKLVQITQNTMVTSDDSTLIPEAHAARDGDFLSRSESQRACQIFLALQRQTRRIALRMVSVLANLPKELIAGNKGEFNSQDTGIGASCPILGFRELISLVVPPSSPSLIGDYLSAHANSKTIALSGQGLNTGNYAHLLFIDSIEQRWRLKEEETAFLNECTIIPEQLVRGSLGVELLSSPASWLSPDVRAFLYTTSIDKNSQTEDLDPHVRDTVFGPMMHVKLSMRLQHKAAISAIETKSREYFLAGMTHQSKMLSDCKRATVSSARTRNLGRVATRITLKQVCPPDYMDHSFSKAPILESTLTWLQKLEEDCKAYVPNEGDILRANKTAGFIKVSCADKFNYPRAPTKRRFTPAHNKPPKYMEGNYGRTPFGKHALHRSGTSVVPKIGIAERVAMQEHLALVRHRSFTDHIEYGGSFVVSWITKTAGVLVSLDITSDVSKQMFEDVAWGDFRPRAIQILKDLQASNPDIPVLAMHRHVGGKGLWHAVYKGRAITVLRSINIEDNMGDAVYDQDNEGRDVLLALQGVSETFEWHGVGPSPREIELYQEAPLMHPTPEIIRQLERQTTSESRVVVPTYSSVIEHAGKSAFVYIAPQIRSIPQDNPRLIPQLRPIRGQTVAELSTGGYWHRSLKGTCFRAFIKDHYHGETIWTGAALGWRLSSTTIPEYRVDEVSARNVRGLYCVGGFNNPDQLSPFNPDMFSEGHKVISAANTLTMDIGHRLSGTYRNLLITANGGTRHYTSDIATFVNFQHEAVQQTPTAAEVMRARQDIINIVFDEIDDAW